MRILLIVLLVISPPLAAHAEPGKKQLAEFYKKDFAPEEVNAFAQLQQLDGVAVEDLKESFNCFAAIDAQKSYIPIKDASCIDEEKLLASWKKNSEIISQYAYIIKLPRFYEDRAAEKPQNFIDLNRLITTKIVNDIANKDKNGAYHIWTNNMEFLQMAISDKQNMVNKSILFVVYGMYTQLAPTLLESSLKDTQKEQVRALMSFEIASMASGWNIADSLAMDYHFATEEMESPAMKKPLAIEVYKLARDAKQLYGYQYNEMEEQVQKIIDKYEVGVVEAMAAAVTSPEKASSIMVVQGLSVGLKLLTLVKFKDIQGKIAALKY